MIIQTTPEIAEGLFEHLLLMGIKDFNIKVSKHKLIDENTKVFFIIENIVEVLQDKILNLIDLYNQLIPDQRTVVASTDDINDTQNFWTPVKNFSLGLAADSPIKLQRKVGFGIGLHPSTILTLRAIEKNLKKIKMFVDVGSGSGILSMYAQIMGAERIIAFEIHDEAIITMKENFYFNNLDVSDIAFNPYLTKEERDEDLRDFRQVDRTTSEFILEDIDKSNSIFVANMRPKELVMCKDILKYGKKFIISGLMNNEQNPINLKEPQILKFGEWRCEI